ncbi:protoheme IX farnesyltransferase, partial [mine drainage metagenome]
FLSNPLALSRLIYLVPLIVAGTLASFSASILNNLYDMDIDGKMHRTKYREDIINPANRRTLAGIAMMFLLGSMLLSYILINFLTTLFIFLGFLSYFLLYTVILKRRTTWNIVIGGIAGSFPALAGWAAVSGNVSVTSLFIAFLVFMWTPTHFWSLASYRSEDYKNANIPMLPAVVGVKAGYRWILVNTVILIAFSLLPVFFTAFKFPSIFHVGIIYYVVAVIFDAYLIYRLIEIHSKQYAPAQFRSAFIFSNFYLLVLLISIWFVIL